MIRHPASRMLLVVIASLVLIGAWAIPVRAVESPSLASLTTPLQPSLVPVPLRAQAGTTAQCSPRPRIDVRVNRLHVGWIQAIVSANTTAGTPNNRLRSLDFSQSTNALVHVAGGPTGPVGNARVALPANTSQAAFYVRPVNPNEASTVHLTVVDDCGPWPTFVGMGAGAR